MDLFINQTLNAVIQVLLFAVPPLIWWFFTARKKDKFLSWVGFKTIKTDNRTHFLLLMLCVGVICYLVGEFALYLRGDLDAAASAYAGMGAAAIPRILMYAFVQTALSEEILFRGFLLKRLARKFGFTTAAVLQAVLFGAVHLLMVWGQTDLIAGIVIVVYPMLVAVVLSWLNEKKAGGSIYPSWILHGLLNTITGIIQAFS